MPRSESQKRARQNYEAKAYDQVLFKVRKGKSAEYTAAASALGLGRMEMLRLAVDEFIERHGGADDGAGASTKTQAESAQPAQKPQLEGENPIIYSEGTQTAQNQPVSTQVQSIQPPAQDTPQATTDNEKCLVEAVKALSPKSQKALLKFLETMQG